MATEGGPKAWNDPEAALKQQEFWIIYETCQNNLPPKMAKVLMLRELVGLEAGEVCLETGLSDASYWLTMHRMSWKQTSVAYGYPFNEFVPQSINPESKIAQLSRILNISFIFCGESLFLRKIVLGIPAHSAKT